MLEGRSFANFADKVAFESILSDTGWRKPRETDNGRPGVQKLGTMPRFQPGLRILDGEEVRSIMDADAVDPFVIVGTTVILPLSCKHYMSSCE